MDIIAGIEILLVPKYLLIRGLCLLKYLPVDHELAFKYSCMSRRISWSWSISKGIWVVVLSNVFTVIEVLLLMLEYRLIKGDSSCCQVIGLLLSMAAVQISIYLLPKYELVPSIVFTTCRPWNQIRKIRKRCVICMISIFSVVSCNSNKESLCQVGTIVGRCCCG